MPLPFLPARGKKTKGQKRVAEWQSWEKKALDRKFLIITSILVAIAVPTIATVVVMTSRVLFERRVQPRPTIVNSQPPEFLQPFVCDIKAGFQTGNVRTFIRNVGNAEANGIVPTFTAQLVPLRKVGIAAFDQVVRGNCKDRSLAAPMKNPLLAEQDATPRLPQPTVAMPPLLQGETTQLYGVSCVYYSDSSGTDHATCDTYRLKLADGNQAFVCDGTPRTGKFEGPLTNCGN